MPVWPDILPRDHYKEFGDSTVLIAGGANGIGKALARVLHNELNAKIAILDRSAHDANALVDSLDSIPGRRKSNMVYPVDITNQTEREAAVNRIIADNGPIKYYISTVGFDRRYDIGGTSDEDLLRSFHVNAVGPYQIGVQLTVPGENNGFKPSMREAGGGAIALYSSRHGSEINQPNMMPYGGAKAALESGIRRLAQFGGENNTSENIVRVFGVVPGWVQTEAQVAANPKEAFVNAAKQQLVPVEMFADDYVAPTLFHLSRLSSHYTNRILVIDSGEEKIMRSAVNKGVSAKEAFVLTA